jgi:hypothetical protein
MIKMNFFAVLLLALIGNTPAFAEVTVLGIEGRFAPTAEHAIVSAEPCALRVLLPANITTAGLRADLFQIAGRVARPLPGEINIIPSPDDSRIAIVKLTSPAVERVTRLTLRLHDLGAINLIVYPAPKTRSDQPVLADVLAASRLKLAVCGRSAELRAFLKTHALEFEDLGADVPDTLAPDMLLVGVLSVGDWSRLAASPAKGGLLAFVDDASLLPGVYTHARPAAPATKVTLPLLPALSTDPRAQETLFMLLLTALTPPRP